MRYVRASFSMCSSASYKSIKSALGVTQTAGVECRKDKGVVVHTLRQVVCVKG